MKSKILNAIQEGIKQSFMIDPNSEDENYVKSKISCNTIPYRYRTVDLGLSVKWCEYNLGAYPGNFSEDWNGDYYAWGELEPKINYNWNNYKFNDNKNKFNEVLKYNKSSSIIGPEDDVVTYKLGDFYRIPTLTEQKELCYSTDIDKKWVTNYKDIENLNGVLFTSKIPGFEGNELFFPASGVFVESEIMRTSSAGCYWSSSTACSTSYAHRIYLDVNKLECNAYAQKCHGFSIRGVQNK